MFMIPPKSNAEKKENFFVWLAVSLVGFYCYEAFAGGLVNLANIPINLTSLSLINLLTFALLLIYFQRQKQIQEYNISWYEVIYLSLLIVSIITFCISRYGTALLPVYETSDPGTHLKMASYLVKDGNLSEMYFGPLFNAIHMMVLKPLFDVPNHYKAFILSDMFAFVLSGIVFFALIQSQLKGKHMKLVGIVFSIFYMLGYPLCNHLFGFSYLGISVTIITFLMLVMHIYLCGEYKKTLVVPLLMIGLYGLSICYVLFVPFVAAALVAAICIKFIREKRLFTREFLVTCIEVFLVPLILCLCYMLKYSGLLGGGSLAVEGYINRDLYCNFILIAPFAIYGAFSSYKEKQWFALSIGISIVVYLLITLFLTLKGSVSTYYFFKTHYVLWAVCFYLAVCGFASLYETAKAAAISWGIVAILVVGMALGNGDAFLQERVYLLDFPDSTNSKKIAQIYTLNEFYLNTISVKFTKDDIALNTKSYEHTRNSDNSVLPAYDWLYTYWFEAITVQNFSKYYTWAVSDFQLYIDQVINDGYEYVAVRFDDEFYKNHADYFDYLERIYENNVGFIAKIQ
jgi:hypothetical protein